MEKIDRGEADQLLTIFTKDFGKLEILARAVRKISSKLRAGAELFYLSEIAFVQGKTQKTLTDAILIDKFNNLRSDLTKLRIAHKISEDADDLIRGQEPDQKIWDLLNEVFYKVNNFEIKNSLEIRSSLRTSFPSRPEPTKGQPRYLKLEIIYHYFFWNFVSLLGYTPKIDGCSLQGKETNCDIVKIIKVILRRDWKVLPRLKLEAEHLKLLKSVSEWYRVKINI